jgi:SAM-dependent methyltransferase
MDYKSVFILGRLPAIGRAELESVVGADVLQPAGEQAVVSNLAPNDVDFARLGSTVKLGEVLGSVAGTDWRTVQTEAITLAVRRAQDLSEGKLQVGLSAYGVRVAPRQLMAGGLELKKALRTRGYSVRLVPNQEPALSSAQVLHNHLTGERGMELLLVRQGSHTLVARTTAVQDINAYAHRDQGRPKRDAFVGMLPPKLAQTIVNLAAGPLAASTETVVLDPFCGTGVVLQEALLMGYAAYGTDLEPRMIDYTRQNLEWLQDFTSARPESTKDGESHPENTTLEVGDATNHQWSSPFSVVASEVYLGHPLSSWPSSQKLQEIMGTCNVILEHFLQNVAAQTPVGTRLCLAVPAWRAPNGQLHHLPTLDRLSDLGYNRMSFSGVAAQELVYYRPDQFVARELLVIVRK